ncbi:MAG: hypothetical protein ACRDD7_09350 [Peptostreptococcaceae bacterium]
MELIKIRINNEIKKCKKQRSKHSMFTTTRSYYDGVEKGLEVALGVIDKTLDQLEDEKIAELIKERDLIMNGEKCTLDEIMDMCK